MEYVYAALLLHKLQKDVNEENISSVVKAAGTDVNEAQVCVIYICFEKCVIWVFFDLL